MCGVPKLNLKMLEAQSREGATRAAPLKRKKKDAHSTWQSGRSDICPLRPKQLRDYFRLCQHTFISFRYIKPQGVNSMRLMETVISSR
jgi:hypothetical protein